MTRQPVVTLDTCCVSALANPQPSNDRTEVSALEVLVDLARDQRVGLQVTESYERDTDRLRSDEAKATRATWLASAPTIARVGGVFRLDVSVLDGIDVLGGDADVQLDQDLRAVLGPELARQGRLPSFEAAPGKTAKIMSDIDHLIAHAKSGADWFVTLDKATILNKRSALGELGLVVALPSEVVENLSRSN